MQGLNSGPTSEKGSSLGKQFNHQLLMSSRYKGGNKDVRDKEISFLICQ